MTEPQEPSFKVVDRRRFDEEGEEKPGQDREPAPQQLNVPKTEYSRPPMSFSLFLQTLAHQAMMGLALVPWPDSNLIKKDLVMAKETIDILVMLRDKTVNNLSPEEESMFQGLLYQLQIAFVEISNMPDGEMPKHS
jgi:hypothetical protein